MTGGPYGMNVTFDDGTVFDMDSVAHYFLSVHVPLPSMPGQTPDTGRFTVDGDVAGESNRFMTLTFQKTFSSDALPSPDGGFDVGYFDQALFSYRGLPDVFGTFYASGIGVVQDRDRALDWYRQAASHGHVEARDAVRGLQGQSPDCRNWITNCRML